MRYYSLIEPVKFLVDQTIKNIKAKNYDHKTNANRFFSN